MSQLLNNADSTHAELWHRLMMQPKSRANALTGTIKRKQKQMADLLQDLGMETLEDRLQSATASPAVPSHRFAQLIQVTGDSNARCSTMPVACPHPNFDCLMLPAHFIMHSRLLKNNPSCPYNPKKAIALHAIGILQALLCTSGQHSIRQASLGSRGLSAIPLFFFPRCG